METPSYYAIIPANIRYAEDLSEFQKLLYGEVTALTDKTGFCWAGNNYFAELYKKTPDRISRVLNDMNKKGYIDIFVDPTKGNLRKIYIGEIKKSTGKIVKIPIVENTKAIVENDKPIVKNTNTHSGKHLDPIGEKDKHNNTSITIRNNNIILSKDNIEQSSDFFNLGINNLEENNLKIETEVISQDLEKSSAGGEDIGYGNLEIFSALKFLKEKCCVSDFKESQKQQRLYTKHIISLKKKIGDKDFLFRLTSILKNDFKLQNCNSIIYLYKELKSFILTPLAKLDFEISDLLSNQPKKIQDKVNGFRKNYTKEINIAIIKNMIQTAGGVI